MGCGASASAEYAPRLDAVEAQCTELKDVTDDASLARQKTNAEELNAVFNIIVGKGGKDGEGLNRIDRLSNAVLDNLCSRITVELLDRSDFTAIEASIMEIAKLLDAVRATKASTHVEGKIDEMKDQKGGPELKKVTDCVIAVQKATDLGDGLPKVLDAASEAFNAAPSSKKMATSLLNLLNQCCVSVKAFLPQLMASDMVAVGKVIDTCKRLDGLGDQLVVVVDNKWEPIAPGHEATVTLKAAEVFEFQLKDAEDAFARDAGGDAYKALVVLSPWWPFAKDTAGASKRLSGVLELGEKAASEAYKEKKAAGEKDICEAILGFAKDLDKLRKTFTGHEAADGHDLYSRLTSLEKVVVLLGHMQALEAEVAKAGPGSGAVSLKAVVDAMEGMAEHWDEATKAGSAPTERLATARSHLETWTLGLVAGADVAKIEGLIKFAAKYDEICAKLAGSPDEPLAAKLTKSAAKAILETIQGQLTKEKGMNPNVLDEQLNFLVPLWPQMSADEELVAALSAVFGQLRDRMVESCVEAAVEDNAKKLRALLAFAKKLHILQESLGKALPGFLATVARAGADTDLKDVEAELAKEVGMNTQALIRSIQNIQMYWPEIADEDDTPGKYADPIDRYADYGVRLKEACSQVYTRMVGAYIEGDETKRGKLLLFADTFDTACTGLTGFPPPELRTKLTAAGVSGRASLGASATGDVAEGAEATAAAVASEAAAEGAEEAAAEEGVDMGAAIVEGDAVAVDSTVGAVVAAEGAAKGAAEGAAAAAAEAAAEAMSPAMVAARAKLEAMKSSEVQKLARSLGISEEDRDRALDADDPKAALLELIWTVQKVALEAEEVERKKLEEMKSSDLQKLARSMGIDEDARDKALDADDPNAAFIELILPLRMAQAQP